MKCLYLFKDKSKSKRNQNKSSNPAVDRLTKSSGSLPSPRSIPELYEENAQELRVFSFQELWKATNGFNRLLCIGGGGFGSVYKGTIQPLNGQGNPTVVAIKKLNQHSLQGHRQWLAEVQFLGVLSHPHLIKLIGFCFEDGEKMIQRLLVYEYMPNWSLGDHLFNRTLPVLPWIKRLEIIHGAAEGLAYLHDGLEVKIIYRDFKSTNVLLDRDFRPKLSDFGLAREGPTGDRTHVSTKVVGTHGYLAPEYVETGHLRVQSDVWTFGVFLYEVLTGRRVLERNRPTTKQKLLDWVKRYPADDNTFSKIMDPRLRGDFPPNAAKKIAKLADSCLVKNVKDRPTMNQVVESLKQAIQESQVP